MEQVISFFKEQGLYDENFFIYIKDKVKVLPYDVSLSWFGCFPIVKDDIIVDIRLSVPEIITEQNLFAYELYNELGKVYVPNIEEREKSASDFEKSYILRKKKTK